jgi:histidinol-phosphate aminotransferase
MFNKKLKNLKPYDVSKRFGGTNDERPKVLLDWNESTKVFSTKFENKIKNIYKNLDVNFYSDIDCKKLRHSISKYVNCDEDEISVFNGSDSALNIIFESILDPEDFVLKVEPDYSQIDTFIKMKGASIVKINSRNVFEKCIHDIKNALKKKKIKAFYLSNPNNPTGIFYNEEELENLILKFPRTWFLIDEAYADYLGKTFCSLITKNKNVMIVKTFSKAFGLAGLRLGYVVSNKSNIIQINKIRNGKEVNTIAQEVVKLALEHMDEFQIFLEGIRKNKKEFLKNLKTLNGLEIIDTSVNFILIKCNQNEQLVNFLRSKNIFIRDRSKMYGLKNFSRISIGSNEEMDLVFKNIQSFFRTGI